MRNLDLTKTDNIIKFANNYFEYKDKVALPKDIFAKIDLEIESYNQMMITNNELKNRIIDITLEFINSLKK